MILMARVRKFLIAALVLLIAGTGPGVPAAPVKKPMPMFSEMRENLGFAILCRAEDPFIVLVRRFEANPDHHIYDGFLFTLHRQGSRSESKPFIAVRSDGTEWFVYEWLDLDRDGLVDAEGEIFIFHSFDEEEQDYAIAVHVCAVARLLKLR